MPNTRGKQWEHLRISLQQVLHDYHMPEIKYIPETPKIQLPCHNGKQKKVRYPESQSTDKYVYISTHRLSEPIGTNSYQYPVENISAQAAYAPYNNLATEQVHINHNQPQQWKVDLYAQVCQQQVVNDYQ